jgi:hypothetical protein
MDDRLLAGLDDRIWERLPSLKSYSKLLLLYLRRIDPENKGAETKMFRVLEKTGMCNRSLTLAIEELVIGGMISYTKQDALATMRILM